MSKQDNSKNHNSDEVFSNVEMLVDKFDAPERDEWQKPEEVIEALHLPNDAVVVEIGSSTGYFAIRLAEHLENGKLIGFEPSLKMTTYLRERADKLGLTNIDARTTEPDGSIVLEERVDLIFSVDVYHHLKDRIDYFTKMATHLKPGGVIAVIDRTEEKVEGQPVGHRVPKEQILDEMKAAGFELTKEFDFLLPVQHFMLFSHVS